MKKLLALILSSLFFISCSWWDVELLKYFEFYTDIAEITGHTVNNVQNVKSIPPSKEAQIIQFSVKNPQNYTLIPTIKEWTDKIVGEVSKDSYSLVQPGNNKYVIELTLQPEFFDSIADPQNIGATIDIQETASGRFFEPYEYSLIVNTPPPVPGNTRLLTHVSGDLKKWVVAFDLPAEEERKGIHKDITGVRINDTVFAVTNTNGTFTFNNGLTSTPPENLLDVEGNEFTPASDNADTVYYITEVARSENFSVEITFVDSNGLSTSGDIVSETIPTDSAQIESFVVQAEQSEVNGIINVHPTGTDSSVRFTLRNTENYTLIPTISWTDAVKNSSGNTPVENADFTLEQTDSNRNELILTLKNEFLEYIDSYDKEDSIGATIRIKEKLTGKEFNPYSYSLVVNTPPPAPKNPALLKHADIATWVLAFDLPTIIERQGLHGDIKTIKINNGIQESTYTVTNTNGTFSFDRDLTHVAPHNALVDANGNPFTVTTDTVYLVTDRLASQSPTITVTFEDDKGLSATRTVNAAGAVKTEYYVSQTGDDNYTGSENKPYRTIQKAITEILATNESSYTIQVSGNIGNNTINVAQSRNITIQGAGSSDIVNNLEISGSGANITLGNNLTVTNLALSNNATVRLLGASVGSIDFDSTAVNVSAGVKPTNQITIAVPSGTSNKTLLINNNGANLDEGDFSLSASHEGSLYTSGGNLYYSSYKDIVWSGETLNTVSVAPDIAGVSPSLILDSNFNITSATAMISFDNSDTTESDKRNALQAAFVSAFENKLPDTINAVTTGDIEIDFAGKTVDVTLRAKTGYAFDKVNAVREKTVRVIIDGNFSFYTKVNWIGLTTNAVSVINGRAGISSFAIPSSLPSGSIVVATTPTVTFTGNDALSANSQLASIRAGLMQAFSSKLPLGVSVPEERISIAPNAINKKEAVITLVLVSGSEYIFSTSSGNVQEISVSANVTSDTNFGDVITITDTQIDDIDSRPTNGNGLSFSGTWAITDGVFVGGGASVTVESGATEEMLGTALEGAISIANVSSVSVSHYSGSISSGSVTMRATLTAAGGYVFTGNSGTKTIQITVSVIQTIVDTQIDTYGFYPNNTGNLNFSGTWAITNGAFDSSDAGVTITSSASGVDIANALKNSTISINNAALTNVTYVSGNIPGNVTLSATLTANSGYVFNTGVTKTIDIVVQTIQTIIDTAIDATNISPSNGNGMTFAGTWAITDGVFVDGGASVTVVSSVTEAMLETVLESSINIANVSTVSVSHYSGGIWSNSVTMRATLTAGTGYVFNTGATKTIDINVAVVQTIQNNDIDVYYIYPNTTGSVESYWGDWSITDGVFSGSGAKFVVRSSAVNSEIADALDGTISISNATQADTTFVSGTIPGNITLRVAFNANSGYVFDTGATKTIDIVVETVQIIADTAIDAADIRPANTATMTFTGSWAITDTNFVGTDVAVTVSSGVTDNDIANAVKNAITIPNVTVDSVQLSYGGISSGYVSYNVVLDPASGYEFANGYTEKSIYNIYIDIIREITDADLDDTDVRPYDSYSMTYIGDWVITDGVFVGPNAVAILGPGDSADYNYIADSISDRISITNTDDSVAYTGGSLPGTVTYTVTLTPQTGYVFASGDPTEDIVITFEGKQAFDIYSDLDDSDIKPVDDATVGMTFAGEWQIDNGEFYFWSPEPTLTIAAGKIVTRENVASALEAVISINNTTIDVAGDATPVSDGSFTIAATLTAAPGYVFDSAGATTKTFDITFTVRREYTMTFTPNGGTGGPTTASGADVQLPSEIPTNGTNMFMGWATNQTGTPVDYVIFPYAITADTTVYARWEPAGTYPVIPSDSYTVNGDGTVSIENDDFLGGATEVVIPPMINGKPVTSIGSYAFKNNTTLTTVTIPDTVTIIDREAFAYSGLTSITIPDTVTQIGQMAFLDCAGITSITIPDSVTSIDWRAFEGTSVTTLHIPASVEGIGGSAFESTTLASITVDANSEYFAADGGVLYGKEGGINTSLIAYPSAKTGTSFAVPEGVITIAEGAFSGASSLTELTLPSTLKETGSYAFDELKITELALPEGFNSFGAHNYFPELTSITIPNSLVWLDPYATQGWPKLTTYNVANNHPTLQVRDGVLLGKGWSGEDVLQICDYPAGKTETTYTIPDDVVKIPGLAIRDNSFLEILNIPDTVLEVEQRGIDLSYGPLTTINVEHATIPSEWNSSWYSAPSGVTPTTGVSMP